MQPQILVAIALYVLLVPFSAPDLSADRAALLSLRYAVGGRSRLWQVDDATPCSWAGVSCVSGRVTILRLPGASLSGRIPDAVFFNLTRLRTLSLRLNSLTGSVPDLSPCTDLRNVYLQGNRFNGEIPGSLFTIHSLVRLNLASNNLIGAISEGFNNLTRLKTLFLENNHLSGSIPADLKPLKLELLNISYNELNGSIPKGLQSFNTASFSGNSLCGKPLASCPEDRVPPAPAPQDNDNTEGVKKGKKKLSGSEISGIAIGCVFGFLLIIVVLICLFRRGGHKRTRSVDLSALNKPRGMGLNTGEMKEIWDSDIGGLSDSLMTVGPTKAEVGDGTLSPKKLMFFGNAPRVYDLEDLLRASAEVLGKGTFGTTYKAVLEVGMAVAVKRLKDVTVSAKDFKERIEEVGAMNHENLVPLRAYYYSNDEKLLVFDFMSMGSLSALLHGNKGSGRTPLNWEIRSSIALEAARGIEYIHSRGPNFSHGSIKSSNILLTRTYEARVSDYGLTSLVAPSSTPSRVAGYRAPELIEPQRTSQKADVYSFGVLLLELLTGKAPIHSFLNEEGVDLPRWVQSVVREKWTSEVFDLELLRHKNVEQEMVQLMQLAIDCCAQLPDSRPPMDEITRRIKELCRTN
ncbi:hypothetical protein SAY86_020894 [Trapa natans]|uniref:Protein kinase domain-containing protein n=1 Tax=Trapa natans TaxID=22666 RepID=A0AAN7MJH1_TRANT|nr:hypothetical protein SAY86_020894 [Trapa natans]